MSAEFPWVPATNTYEGLWRPGIVPRPIYDKNVDTSFTTRETDMAPLKYDNQEYPWKRTLAAPNKLWQPPNASTVSEEAVACSALISADQNTDTQPDIRWPLTLLGLDP